MRTARLDARNRVGNRIDVKRGRRRWFDRRGQRVSLYRTLERASGKRTDEN